MLAKLFFVVTLLCSSCAKCDFGCRDEANKVVDWFYLYKLPEVTSGKHSSSGGFDYAFVTSATINDENKWIISNKSANRTDSVPGLTLSPIYKNAKNLLSIFYNDEPPQGKTDGSRGHTKGVVAGDNNGGFWLIHSVPHFPPDFSSDGYYYPETGKLYGQSFLCITLPSDELEKVGTQLAYNEPHIYSSFIPENLRSIYPNLVKATNMNPITTPPFWNLQKIKTKGGVQFQSFAKTRHFAKELYVDWIAPTLNTDLYVETWAHGAGDLSSNCSQIKKVFNVADIAINPKLTFTTLHDHSKWAVSPEGNNWICVGDINRQEHQKFRGGGSVCQSSKAISKIYRDTIAHFQPCPK